MSLVAPVLTGGQGKHSGQPVALAGAALDQADGALVLAHGRGADAAGMLDLARALVGPGVACLALQAAGHVWYPRRFLEPVAENEPDLSSALSVLSDLVERLSARLTPLRVVVLGFSQGACLAAEYVRRRGQPLGGLIAFSGGLIGDVVGSVAGDLGGMPALLGCSEHDPHIPATRVRETATALSAMDAAVTTLLYPGSGHAVAPEEIALARRLLAARLGPPTR